MVVNTRMSTPSSMSDPTQTSDDQMAAQFERIIRRVKS
jgi:hypothetical protein